MTLSVTGVEWNFDNLVRGLGAGELADSPANTKRFRFGGDMGVSNLSLCYRHHTAEGDEIFVKLWCAQGQGEISISFGDDFHEFPYVFEAIQPDPLVAWGDDPHDPAGTLADKEHLAEVTLEQR